jgi:hypothetical protein
MDTQPKNAKQALAEDKYDDCLSCRITGMLYLWPVTWACILLALGVLTSCNRICCFYWPRSLQLLHRNDQSPETREGHHERSHKIQDGLAQVGDCLDLCDISRNGAVAGV